jgi:N-acetyl-anhydromuramoyl-L-alanine amidase
MASPPPRRHHAEPMRRGTSHHRARLDVDASSGLASAARQVASPNCDDRPPGVFPDLVLIHSISLPPGTYGGPWIDRLFTNSLRPDAHPYFRDIAALRVSSHVLVSRNGEFTQYVPFHRRAWHAGESCFEGRRACNDFSIGIELEGLDGDGYEEVQYAQLAALIHALCRAYPSLSRGRIAGHEDVAPGRKTDPGPGFDWPHLRSLLARAGAGGGSP